MGRDAGRNAGKGSLAAFETFISNRKAQNDWQDYVSSGATALLREKIAAACGFKRQVFYQNPAIKIRLQKLEQRLRAEKILAPGRQLEETQPTLHDEDDHAFRAEQLKAKVLEQKADLAIVRQRLDEVEQQLLLITGE